MIRRVSRPVRPGCWAAASSMTPISRPGLGRSAYGRPSMVTRPGGRRGEAGEHPQRGGLPGPVRPEEAGHGARFAGERDVVHGDVLVVTLGEVFGGDHAAYCPASGPAGTSAERPSRPPTKVDGPAADRELSAAVSARLRAIGWADEPRSRWRSSWPGGRARAAATWSSSCCARLNTLVGAYVVFRDVGSGRVGLVIVPGAIATAAMWWRRRYPLAVTAHRRRAVPGLTGVAAVGVRSVDDRRPAPGPGAGRGHRRRRAAA